MFRIYIEFNFGARHPPDPYVPNLYQVDYEPALIYIPNITIKPNLVQSILMYVLLCYKFTVSDYDPRKQERS